MSQGTSQSRSQHSALVYHFHVDIRFSLSISNGPVFPALSHLQQFTCTGNTGRCNWRPVCIFLEFQDSRTCGRMIMLPPQCTWWVSSGLLAILHRDHIHFDLDTRYWWMSFSAREPAIGSGVPHGGGVGQLLDILWQMLSLLWRRGTVPAAMGLGRGCLLTCLICCVCICHIVCAIM